jgi:AraC family transcriptional regulator
MILKQFPNLQWLKHKAESSFVDQKGVNGQDLPNKGWPNVILNVTDQKTYRDNIKGPLSLFTNVSGESAVTTDKRRTVIKEGFFFLTNREQYYTLEIEKAKTETFNIHFGEYFSEQVFASLARNPEMLIDTDVSVTGGKSIGFYNKLYQRTPSIDTLIAQIKDNGTDKFFLEEKLYELVGLFLADHRSIKKVERELPALRKSTREEILKRLLLSTDYIYSHYDHDISLDALASVCCLSKFHFLRLFKIAFKITPHQFINRVRIERAQQLLKASQLEVSTIGKTVGFKDSSSFSRAFKTTIGAYPTQYRSMI